jgi:2-polyprenyl-3-methyl-5-hydroxy-6-metoxy-1,4-benzoquinol methylase
MTLEFYERNAEDYFRTTVGIDMAVPRERFANLLSPGARVLDAGCGSGRDARVFHEMGFQVTAFDASPRLVALARAHTGLPVKVSTFQEVAWREAFDGLWASASLLHVPRAELPSIMRRLRDVLTPGGLWHMSFKYGAGEREVEGRRFTDLDERTAEALVAGVGGLEVVWMGVEPSRKPQAPDERWLVLLCRRAA